MTPRFPLAPVLAAALASIVLVGCGSSAEPVAAEPTPAPTTQAPTPSPTPTPAVQPAVAPTDPLTGAAAVPPGPVVALKVDNAPLARPFHAGLGEASLVYQELVEGGATRFLAMYAPASGIEVGPIRSGRENDIELLAQFGKVPLGYSGANSAVAGMFAQAHADGRLINVSRDVTRAPYRTAGKRKDANNYYTSPEKVAAAGPGGEPVKDIGLRFGPLAAEVGTPVGAARVVFSNRTRVDVRYDAASGRWSVLQDGAVMGGVAPANVIVQSVQIRSTDFVDTTGNRTPFSLTVGDGPVTVLRDGKRIEGSWRRLAPHSGTRFLDPAGRDIPLRPGPTWFLLMPAGQSLSFS